MDPFKRRYYNYRGDRTTDLRAEAYKIETYILRQPPVKDMPIVVHFEIHADDPERAAEFYQSVFGWEI